MDLSMGSAGDVLTQSQEWSSHFGAWTPCCFPKSTRKRQLNNRTDQKTFDIPGWWVVSCGILSSGVYNIWSVYTRWGPPVIFVGLWTRNPNRGRQPTPLVLVMCCSTNERSFMVFHFWGYFSVCEFQNLIDLIATIRQPRFLAWGSASRNTSELCKLATIEIEASTFEEHLGVN